MDFKEKIEKAAKHEAYDNYDRSYNDRRDGFIKGAEWLQSQPIADRLTEGERERIRDIYWQAMKDWIGIGDARGHCRTCIAIEQIFGKEMFQNKE